MRFWDSSRRVYRYRNVTQVFGHRWVCPGHRRALVITFVTALLDLISPAGTAPNTGGDQVSRTMAGALKGRGSHFRSLRTCTAPCFGNGGVSQRRSTLRGTKRAPRTFLTLGWDAFSENPPYRINIKALPVICSASASIPFLAWG